MPHRGNELISAGTPAGSAESLRTGAGPVAFMLLHEDVNLATGAMVAGGLYAMQTGEAAT